MYYTEVGYRTPWTESPNLCKTKAPASAHCERQGTTKLSKDFTKMVTNASIPRGTEERRPPPCGQPSLLHFSLYLFPTITARSLLASVPPLLLMWAGRLLGKAPGSQSFAKGHGGSQMYRQPGERVGRGKCECAPPSGGLTTAHIIST